MSSHRGVNKGDWRESRNISAQLANSVLQSFDLSFRHIDSVL
jgi:hypothetical protein